MKTHRHSLRALLLALTVTATPVHAQVVAMGGTAREFQLPHYTTRQPVKLSDYAGKILVLDFFAYWCGPCQTSSPDLQRNLQQYYAGRGGNPAGVPVQVLAVNIDQSNPPLTDSFIRNAGLDLVGDDTTRAIWNQFNERGSIPLFVVISGVAGPSQWQVLQKDAGYSTAATITRLRQTIDAVTAGGGASVSPPSTLPSGSSQTLGSAFTFTTLAGSAGQNGSTDGTGSDVRLNAPTGLAVDRTGNLFITDTGNSIIRKITPGGTVTTFAGQARSAGNVDGTLATARLAAPWGLAFDETGSLYVADAAAHTIRKISPAGIVTTLAGLAGTTGTANGPGSTARFNRPTGLAVDRAGNVFVADAMNSTLRKITAGGVVTTFAGLAGTTGSTDGPGSTALFNHPSDVAVDGAGNLFVADGDNHTIRKITPDGTVSTFAGQARSVGSTDGIGPAARFSAPVGLAVDQASNLYVAEFTNCTIRKITPGGTVTTLAGLTGTIGTADATGAGTRFNQPYDVAVDGAGVLYVADTKSHTIRQGMLTIAANPSARLVNLSVRANLVPDEQLVTGFVLAGGVKPMLVRAVGPGLAPFLPDSTCAGNPSLQLYNATTLLESNDNWGGVTALVNACSGVGAFPLPANSQDAAVLCAVEGARTAHMAVTTNGVGLIEVYDTATAQTPRLVNVSARYQAGSGADTLIAGFVIAGTGEKTMLVRAVGPTLGQLGVSGVLADPTLAVFNTAQQLIAENNDWPAVIAEVMRRAGAFALPAGSKDAALVVTLPPGGYTAQVTGVNNSTGAALVEIYELEP
jgi:sugar lactone lactonase YvrE/thiol-disulfide isomerase/thioredoxin